MQKVIVTSGYVVVETQLGFTKALALRVTEYTPEPYKGIHGHVFEFLDHKDKQVPKIPVVAIYFDSESGHDCKDMNSLLESKPVFEAMGDGYFRYRQSSIKDSRMINFIESMGTSLYGITRSDWERIENEVNSQLNSH